MSNYTKTTNFTAKDALTSGDPNKVIKGSENDTEFDNIATMSTTKVDKVASPSSGNVAELTGAGNVADSGFSFPNLSGAIGLDNTEIGILEGATLLTADINILAGADAVGLTSTELLYVNGVTSDIQTQLSDKMSGANNLTELTDLYVARQNLELDTLGIDHLYLGTGDDGSSIITNDTDLDSGEYHYTSLTINTGQNLGVNETEDGFLIIRCTGTVTLTGTASINLEGKGGAAGLGVEFTRGANGSSGTGGGTGGGGGGQSASLDGGEGGSSIFKGVTIVGGIGSESSGTDGTAGSNTSTRVERLIAYVLDPLNYTGSGGGSGSSSTDTGGDGGNGGGFICIVADTIDFTTNATMKCNGADGSSPAISGGGGGGGGGGGIILIANTITNDGTMTVGGGAAATGVGSFGDGGAGGNGITKVLTL